MNAYLKIAEQVLDVSKRPLHAKEILEYAYLNDLVDEHLYGKTQHKTLQARLSENILEYGNDSLFFRTSPGFFFLRKFLSDETIPDKYKEVFKSRRRVRDLKKSPILTLTINKIQHLLKKSGENIITDYEPFLSIENTKYKNYREAVDGDDIPVWSFVIFFKENRILTHRLGRYREDRDSFANQQTIGFPSLLTDNDRCLFEQKDHGLVMSGVTKTIIDLGECIEEFDLPDLRQRSELNFFICLEDDRNKSDFLGVITFDCPNWFEPVKNKLAINDLRWLDMTKPINNIEDFDPWSRHLFDKIKPIVMKRAA